MNLYAQPMIKWPSLALKHQRGFTLTELLVSMGLSLFVLAGVGSLFRAQSHTVKGQESKMEANEYALTVLDMVVREVRNAGYFPSTACPAGPDGILNATATTVTIYYDKNSDGACSGDDEIVVFDYDAANKNVTRNGVALSDGNATALTFTYYPQQTSATAPAPYCISGVPSGCSGTLSSSYKTVQKITISLTVAPKSTDSNFTGSPVTMSLTADLRNHGI